MVLGSLGGLCIEFDVETDDGDAAFCVFAIGLLALGTIEAENNHRR